MVDKNADRVTITDVTLREFGQNVPGTYIHIFTPGIRARIASKLMDAGFRSLEVLSCIHPKVAPAVSCSIMAAIASMISGVFLPVAASRHLLPGPYHGLNPRL
ncbi:MAG: hypothetical protein ISS63_15655 [Desulfobacteraceae bacterium]|nr:hypothetical protein [Desulfobacteraceae bacterium]